MVPYAWQKLSKAAKVGYFLSLLFFVCLGGLVLVLLFFCSPPQGIIRPMHILRKHSICNSIPFKFILFSPTLRMKNCCVFCLFVLVLLFGFCLLFFKKEKKKYMLQMFVGLITSYREHLIHILLLDNGQKKIKHDI